MKSLPTAGGGIICAPLSTLEPDGYHVTTRGSGVQVQEIGYFDVNGVG
ncbi:MAG: hypothetical protein U0401_30230 [Anaerolineae bacterium]